MLDSNSIKRRGPCRELKIAVHMNTKHRMIQKFLFLVLFCSHFLTAHAVTDEIAHEKRVALIIGNSEYSIGALPNAGKDAQLMEKKLTAVGFDTTFVKNGGRREMLLAISKFKDKLVDSDVGLFYYAGHALQYKGINYMLPTKGTEYMTETTVHIDAVEVDSIVMMMKEAENSINLIILDACRNNPFKSFSRSVSRGLAPPNVAARGMYIAYSTAPGEVASDGDSENSPYTTALAKHIENPGQTIHDLFLKVRNEVMAATDGSQVPWENSSLTDNFYFAGSMDPEQAAQEQKIADEVAALKQQLLDLKKSAQDKEINDELAAKARQQESLQQESLRKQREQQEELARQEVTRLKEQQLLLEKQTAVAQAVREEQLRIAAIQKEQDKKDALERNKQAKINQQQALALRKPIEEATKKDNETTEQLLARQKELIAIEKMAQEKLDKLNAATEAANEERLRFETLASEKQKKLELENQRLIEESLANKKAIALAEKKQQQLQASLQKEKQQREALSATAPQDSVNQTASFAEQRASALAIEEGKLIAKMLGQCDSWFKKYKSSVKPAECYQDVLQIDAENERARNGISATQKRLKDAVNQAIVDRKIKTATKNLALLEEISQTKSPILSQEVDQLRIEIEQERSEVKPVKVISTF